MTAKKKSTDKKIRIGLIGAGMYTAAAHVPALHRFPSVEITAVCRTHPERLDKFCETYDVENGYTDYKEMLKKEELDGVIIATPNYLHFELAMACMKKGIPILLEKPMTIKAGDAIKIYEYSNEHDIPVVIGYNRHYWANFCYAKKMIEEDQIGIIQNINVRWLADIEWALARREPPEPIREKGFLDIGGEPSFRGSKELAGGGMFIDGGSNMLDAVMWLTDLKPAEVFAWMDNRGFHTDCDTTLTVKFDTDTLCSCTVMGTAKTLKGHQIFIYGSKGSVYVDDYTIFYQLNNEKEIQVVDLPADSCPTANFVQVLQNKEHIHSTAKQGARTAIAVEHVYESAEKKKPVTIKEWIE